MARMVLRRAQPDPAFFLTAGKLGELKGLVSTEGAVLVVLTMNSLRFKPVTWRKNWRLKLSTGRS